ncbi:hypothetical protein [Arthrobacter sp. HY1533]|uniref:hypothetical protein n=1 Tax=Arthrobacter sp. HY1533 TaxID=2970919 RepID=UPI0022B9D8E8|nr:hypothetical protein [Arthrobacter sp. HY1533]
MTKRTCPECNINFTPASPRQRFCRPACAHRQRQRQYRQSNTRCYPQGVAQATFNNREATLAAITARFQSELQLIRIADKRKQNSLMRTYDNKLDAAYAKLNESARSLSRAESKADELERSVQHLQHENADRLLQERQAVRDMQQLAARVLALHSETNTRLDPSTAAIFARHGWNTEMGRS